MDQDTGIPSGWDGDTFSNPLLWDASNGGVSVVEQLYIPFLLVFVGLVDLDCAMLSSTVCIPSYRSVYATNTPVGWKNHE